MRIPKQAEIALGVESHTFVVVVEIARGALQVARNTLRGGSAQNVIRDENAAEAGASRLADVAVERWVAARSQPLGISLLSEEAGDIPAPRATHYLVLDPIDGTSMALRGLPLYGVAVAVGRLEDGKKYLHNLIFSVVCSPMGEFFGIRNGGAYSGFEPLRTSSVERLEEAMVRLPQQRQRRRGLSFDAGDFLYLGCTALELCWLAAGALDVYVETKRRKVFDFAAGMLIVQEAGGAVTTLEGEPVLPGEIDVLSRSTLLAVANKQLANDLRVRL